MLASLPPVVITLEPLEALALLMSAQIAYRSVGFNRLFVSEVARQAGRKIQSQVFDSDIWKPFIEHNWNADFTFGDEEGVIPK